MMHEDADDDDGEDVVLDRQTLIDPSNAGNDSNNGNSMLLGVNRFNIKVYDDPIKVSRTKSILLAATCVSIGMLTGLLGPTIPFLAQRMQTESSAIVWLIAMKAIGFLVGTLLSAYLYAWFNVCCLLGLSCLAISFAICSLPFISDLTTFYITSFILGLGLSISHSGIDALYNRLWTRSSLASVRWLHLLVACGAVLSILMLFPSAISKSTDDPQTTTMPKLDRPRREGSQDLAVLLAAMTPDVDGVNLLDDTLLSNRSNETTISVTSSTTTKVILKPSVVETVDLKQTLVAKPVAEGDKDVPKGPCVKSFCCYDRNATSQNETIPNVSFDCQEQTANQSSICKSVLVACQPLLGQVCQVNSTSLWCRIDQVCGTNKKPDCTIASIDAAIEASKTTTTTTVLTSTTNTTIALTAGTTTLPSTTPVATTTTTTTTTTTSTTTTTATTTTATTTQRSTTHRSKPSMAESDIDERSENLLRKKIGAFFRSASSVHMIYIFLALAFFLLAISYSILAMRGEGSPSSTKPVNINPLTLLFGQSLRPMPNGNAQLSLFSDRASWKFVSILILFYFLLAGIENCCTYLTYLFGMELKYSERQSLTWQFLFFLGLLVGRLLDIFVEYGCFLFNTRITNRTKKQSDKFHLVSIKFCILIRLALLVVLCSTLSFSHLFQDTSKIRSSAPSLQMFYLLFFLIGFLIASLPTLILSWIERDLSLNDSLIRIILLTITLSEVIFPPFVFYTIKHVVLSYLFYLFIGSCCLFGLFICILYSGKRWQRKKLYRILPTSLEIDEIDVENSSDHEQEELQMRNGRTNINGSKLTLDNERAKGFKGH